MDYAAMEDEAYAEAETWAAEAEEQADLWASIQCGQNGIDISQILGESGDELLDSTQESSDQQRDAEKDANLANDDEDEDELNRAESSESETQDEADPFKGYDADTSEKSYGFRTLRKSEKKSMVHEVLEAKLKLDAYVQVENMEWKERMKPFREGLYSGVIDKKKRPHGRGTFTWVYYNEEGEVEESLYGLWCKGNFIPDEVISRHIEKNEEEPQHSDNTNSENVEEPISELEVNGMVQCDLNPPDEMARNESGASEEKGSRPGKLSKSRGFLGSVRGMATSTDGRRPSLFKRFVDSSMRTFDDTENLEETQQDETTGGTRGRRNSIYNMVVGSLRNITHTMKEDDEPVEPSEKEMKLPMVHDKPVRVNRKSKSKDEDETRDCKKSHAKAKHLDNHLLSGYKIEDDDAVEPEIRRKSEGDEGTSFKPRSRSNKDRALRSSMPVGGSYKPRSRGDKDKALRSSMPIGGSPLKRNSRRTTNDAVLRSSMQGFATIAKRRSSGGIADDVELGPEMSPRSVKSVHIVAGSGSMKHAESVDKIAMIMGR